MTEKYTLVFLECCHEIIISVGSFTLNMFDFQHIGIKHAFIYDKQTKWALYRNTSG